MDWKESPTKIHPLLIFSLKANGVILAIDLLILTLFLLPWGENVENLNPINLMDNLLFLEAGLTLLVGGAVEMASTVFFSKVREHVLHSKEGWSIDEYKRRRRWASRYIFIGLLLLAESILLALVLIL